MFFPSYLMAMDLFLMSRFTINILMNYESFAVSLKVSESDLSNLAGTFEEVLKEYLILEVKQIQGGCSLDV